jgi:hypothetical protein
MLGVAVMSAVAHPNPGGLRCLNCGEEPDTVITSYGALIWCNERCRDAADIESGTWEQIYDRLELREMRPIWDPLLHVIRCDCKDCRAQDGDPLGLYRPVAVRRRNGITTLSCDQCGVHHGF